METLQNARKIKIELLPIKELQNNLRKDERKINLIDLGAKQKKNRTKMVKQVFSQSVSKQKNLNLLYQFIKDFQPLNIIELGTSLGISTAAMALAAPKSKIVTIEGCPDIAQVAHENFSKLKLTNIQQEVAPFDEVLSTLVSEITNPFLVFIDGNHRYEATLGYFKLIIEKASFGSVIILDDIHWSCEMEKAWNKIIQNNKVSISIDLYKVGLLFIREGVVKQNFCIRY